MILRSPTRSLLLHPGYSLTQKTRGKISFSFGVYTVPSPVILQSGKAIYRHQRNYLDEVPHYIQELILSWTLTNNLLLLVTCLTRFQDSWKYFFVFQVMKGWSRYANSLVLLYPSILISRWIIQYCSFHYSVGAWNCLHNGCLFPQCNARVYTER